MWMYYSVVCSWLLVTWFSVFISRTANGDIEKQSDLICVFGWLERSSTAGKFSNFQNAGRNVYKEVAIMWKNKESYVD